MARMQSLSLLVYLILHLFLNTSHAYQHRHLRQKAIYQDQAHEQVVEAAGESRESVSKRQTLDELQRKLNERLAWRSSILQLLDQEDLRKQKEKRWRGHRHHRHHGTDRNRHHNNDANRGGSEFYSFTFEELQQKLDELNQAIRSLYDLLSSSFGAGSGSTTLSATSTSISSQYNATITPASSTSIAFFTNASFSGTSTPASSSPIFNSTDISFIATATATSNSTHTVNSTSSTLEPASSATARYTFDPMSSSNVAVYYGQTDQTSNVPLSTICADRDVDIVILAFVNKLSTDAIGYPALNMGPHCWATSFAQVNAGASSLIDCVGGGFAEQAKSCQNTGKKVLLSIGGAVGYSETTVSSEEDAVRIADNIWNLFGGGGADNDTITAIRPFGDFVFDGFDIDNEDSSLLHWSLLISTLRTHFSQSSSPTSNSKPYYLSAAPQCPRPDASIPLSSMQTAVDFVFIQFYNNPSCNLDSAGFLSSLQAWSDDLLGSTEGSASGFFDTGNGVSGPRVYVGAPSFPAGGSGWIDRDRFTNVVGRVRELGLQNLGGIMLWDGAYGALSDSDGGGDRDGDGSYGNTTSSGRTYMRLAKDVLG